MPDRHALDEAAPNYANEVGATTSLAARIAIDLATQLLPICSSSYVLDVGAGTGAVTLNVASTLDRPQILATDISPRMLATIRQKTLSCVDTRVTNALEVGRLPEAGSFTHVFSTMMLHELSEPDAAVKAIYDVLSPGGVI